MQKFEGVKAYFTWDTMASRHYFGFRFDFLSSVLYKSAFVAIRLWLQQLKVSPAACNVNQNLADIPVKTDYNYWICRRLRPWILAIIFLVHVSDVNKPLWCQLYNNCLRYEILVCILHVKKVEFNLMRFCDLDSEHMTWNTFCYLA